MLFRQVRTKLCLLLITLAPFSLSFEFDAASCTDVDVNSAVQEAREMAANAHDQLKQSLNGQITGDEGKRISLNYSPWFGSDSTQDANQQLQTAGQEDRAMSVIGT
jgi:hypothetical protein